MLFVIETGARYRKQPYPGEAGFVHGVVTASANQQITAGHEFDKGLVLQLLHTAGVSGSSGPARRIKEGHVYPMSKSLLQ